MTAIHALLLMTVLTADPMGPGDHTRTLMMGEQKRTYLVHVPKGYDPKRSAPVVLALHGAAMNGSMMVWFSGLNKTSDRSGFMVVYQDRDWNRIPLGRLASDLKGRRWANIHNAKSQPSTSP